MRTGHQLNPRQWVYYQALVDSFLHRTEASMESRDHVFGYRARLPRVSAKPFGKPIQQWLDFHRAVKDVAARGTYEAVVITDVAAFFEQIPHDLLEDQLLMLGVSAPAAEELRQSVTALMGGRPRGLPQGCDASSVIASMYLAAVDRALLRAGHAYFRYVDDIRIFAGSEREARRLLRLTEAEVRNSV
jgi:reverse transcriptase-like protein